MPILLRRQDVMAVMGWSKSSYYRFTDGLRLRTYGYVEERIPRALVISWVESEFQPSQTS